MNEIQLAQLRAAFAAALKYDPQYANAHPHLWKMVLRGEKLSPQFTLLNVLGDYFAFWFLELGGDSSNYNEIAHLFFERPWS